MIKASLYLKNKTVIHGATITIENSMVEVFNTPMPIGIKKKYQSDEIDVCEYIENSGWDSISEDELQVLFFNLKWNQNIKVRLRRKSELRGSKEYSKITYNSWITKPENINSISLIDLNQVRTTYNVSDIVSVELDTQFEKYYCHVIYFVEGAIERYEN